MVEEAGDVGEEGAVVVGPALGSQIATGPRKSPNQARSRASGKRKAARARHRGSPGDGRKQQSQGTTSLNNRASVRLVLYAAEIRRKSKHCGGGGKRALPWSLVQAGVRALSLTRPVRRVGKMSCSDDDWVRTPLLSRTLPD